MQEAEQEADDAAFGQVICILVVGLIVGERQTVGRVRRGDEFGNRGVPPLHADAEHGLFEKQPV